MMSKAAEIDIASVSKVYGSTTAVHAISLKIPAGSYCCFLGPSGCGKTSTLRMIAGHESISSGDVRLGSKLHIFAGDYEKAFPGTEHEFLASDTGCELLIISCLEDEILTA